VAKAATRRRAAQADCDGHRLQRRQLLGRRAVTRSVVLRHDRAVGERHRRDLSFEETVLLVRDRELLRARRELVHLQTGHPFDLAHVLGGLPHRDVHVGEAGRRRPRRLTTVLCADVHGYSRLMGADEAGTLGTLRRHRSAIAGLVERHDGRIVNTWGDAVIAEFASVVEAVQCAVEIQQEISNQDSDPPHAHQMRFRIGINLGDVMVDGSDIFGDGVNIAARLQELAEPGGVVVSASVYDQVHNKLSLGFDCLGQQQMKNVVPVISYRVTMGGVGRHSFPVDEGPTPQAGAVAASEAGAQRIRDRYEPSTWMSSISDRLANLPRPIAATLTVSGFLILINVFTGLHRIWFHWPVAALLFIGILRTVLRHKPASDRNEDRRRRQE